MYAKIKGFFLQFVGIGYGVWITIIKPLTAPPAQERDAMPAASSSVAGSKTLCFFNVVDS